MRTGQLSRKVFAASCGALWLCWASTTFCETLLFHSLAARTKVAITFHIITDGAFANTVDMPSHSSRPSCNSVSLLSSVFSRPGMTIL